MAIEEMNPFLNKDDDASKLNKKLKDPVIGRGITSRLPVTTVGAKPVSSGAVITTPDKLDVKPFASNLPTDGEGFFSSEAGRATVDGAITALGQAPKIIQNLSTDAKSSREATAKVLSMTASGASIGGAIVPGWGHLIGGAAGAIGGLAKNSGWADKVLDENNKQTELVADQNSAELKQNYYMNKSADKIQAELNMYKESQGIQTA